MTRWFNIAGPCFPSEHYMVPLEPRAAEARTNIEQGRWFSLVSGRQTGKTTIVKHLARTLTAQTEHLALWVDLQTARGVGDPEIAFRRILGALDEALVAQAPDVPRLDPERRRALLEDPLAAIAARLRELAVSAGRPLVLLFDEADVLVGEAMVSFLTQLRCALSATRQSQIQQQTQWYVTKDGLLDVPKLMSAWQTFWRKDGHLAAEGFSYRESGPHLMLMAFLQRVVNGGGRIEREYALGKGALDLLIAWQTQRIAIEVKLRRDTETEAEAFEQVARYLDSLGLDEGWLVMLDLRKTDWSERLFTRTERVGERTVHVVGS